MNTLLVTFGCSWVYGVGVGYTLGTTLNEYRNIAWDQAVCDKFSFRGQLSKKYNLTNKNFSSGGSSTQRQFRLAKEFFCSDEFKNAQAVFDQIIVLWGITSTSRNELYFTNKKELVNFTYTDNSIESKAIISYFHDHDYEVNCLSKEILFWNDYFVNKKIKNFWVDILNHHNYFKDPADPEIIQQFRLNYNSTSGPDWPSFDDYLAGNYSVEQQIQDEINNATKVYLKSSCLHKNIIFEEKNPRDLLSLLAIANGCTNLDNNYHYSRWISDSNRVEYLVKCDILNPYSCHPTQQGHTQIADMLAPYIESIL